MNKTIKKRFRRMICFVLALTIAMTGIGLPAKRTKAASTTNRVPITCYIKSSGSRLTTYTTSALTKPTGYIAVGDQCKITALLSNGAVKVTYPVSTGTKTAYAAMSGFFANVNFSTGTRKLGSRLTAYRRSTGSSTIGTVYAADYVTVIGTSNGRTQVIYPAGSSYKLGWVAGSYSSSSGSVSSSTSSLSAANIKFLTFNAAFYANTYADLKNAFGYDSTKLYNHWMTYGIREGRAASPVLDIKHYLNNNADLWNAFGGANYSAAYNHFITYGYKEYRNSSPYYNGSYYRKKYSDLSSMSSYNLIWHYLNYGIGEKRYGNSYGKIPNMAQAVSSNSTVAVSLNVPSYKQYDARWGGVYIGNRTIKNIGCLLTSISMKCSYHTRTATYPNVMKGKLSFSNNDLNWLSVTRLGYTCVGPYNSAINNSIMSTVYSKLKAGRPVIMGASNSSGGQHWIIITGYKGTSATSFSSSNFTINDPNSSSRTTLNQFLNIYPKVLKIVY